MQIVELPLKSKADEVGVEKLGKVAEGWRGGCLERFGRGGVGVAEMLRRVKVVVA